MKSVQQWRLPVPEIRYVPQQPLTYIVPIKIAKNKLNVFGQDAPVADTLRRNTLARVRPVPDLSSTTEYSRAYKHYYRKYENTVAVCYS